MSSSNPLDPVIRLIEPKSVIPADGQKIIIIDAVRRAVVPTPPFFRDARYYLVGNSSDARHEGTGTLNAYPLRDIENKADASVKFDIRCPPGNEARVALALFDPADPPGIVIRNYLAKWLRGMSWRNVSAFVDQYFENRGVLEAELVERAHKELGLEMNVRLSLDAECTLNRIDIEDDRLVYVNDFDDEEQYLAWKVGVEVDPDNRTAAVLQCNRFNDIHELVPREIERYIRENVPMQTFWTQLGSAAVRQPLIRHLNNVLHPFGRKVGTLTLTADETPPDLEFLQEGVDIFCELRNYPRPVKISNKVQMSLFDLARYRAAKSPPLKKWLHETLERVVSELLFETRYIDVLLRFPARESDIKNALAERAAAIGYELKQFITVADLEARRLQSPFTIEADGEFLTLGSDLKVKLRLVAIVCIPRLEEIEDKLNGDKPVPELMRQAVLDCVERFLHGVSPKRYYTEFEVPEQPEDLPVQKAIELEIRKELQTNFHCEIFSIAVNPLETEVMARLKGLRQQICDWVVEVPTIYSNTPVVLYGKFQVEAVDSTRDSGGWHRFRSRPATLAEIRKHIEEHLRAKLQTYSLRQLLFRTPEEQQKLAQFLCETAEEYARLQFGLTILVDSIGREATEQERRIVQDQLDRIDARLTISKSNRERALRVHELVNDQREAQLAKLLQEQTNQTAIEGTDDEIALLGGKITTAGNLIENEPIPSMAEVEGTLQPERAIGPSHQIAANAPPEKQPAGGAE